MAHKVSKAKAISLLSKLQKRATEISRLNFNDHLVKKWQDEIKMCIQNIFGDALHQKGCTETFNAVAIRMLGSEGNALFSQRRHEENVQQLSDYLDGLINEIKNFWEDSDVAAGFIENGLPLKDLFDKFPAIVRQLRHRHKDRGTLDVQDEYDVQDLVHSLLWLCTDDVRPEEWTPSCAGSSSRMDFLLPEYETAIEIKMTRKELKNKETAEQLIIDKEHYKVHPQVKQLICFVYDPEGRIDNPRGFEKDLSQDEPLKTVVYVRS